MQVRRARKTGLRIVMAHECDAFRGGCEFGLFFTTVLARNSNQSSSRCFSTDNRVQLHTWQTPDDLVADGLYSDIATSVYGGMHRQVSIAIIARNMGAASNAESRKGPL